MATTPPRSWSTWGSPGPASPRSRSRAVSDRCRGRVAALVRRAPPPWPGQGVRIERRQRRPAGWSQMGDDPHTIACASFFDRFAPITLRVAAAHPPYPTCRWPPTTGPERPEVTPMASPSSSAATDRLPRPRGRQPRRRGPSGRLLVVGMALVVVAALVPRAIADGDGETPTLGFEPSEQVTLGDVALDDQGAGVAEDRDERDGARQTQVNGDGDGVRTLPEGQVAEAADEQALWQPDLTQGSGAAGTDHPAPLPVDGTRGGMVGPGDAQEPQEPIDHRIDRALWFTEYLEGTPEVTLETLLGQIRKLLEEAPDDRKDSLEEAARKIEAQLGRQPQPGAEQGGEQSTSQMRSVPDLAAAPGRTTDAGDRQPATGIPG